MVLQHWQGTKRATLPVSWKLGHANREGCDAVWNQGYFSVQTLHLSQAPLRCSSPFWNFSVGYEWTATTNNCIQQTWHRCKSCTAAGRPSYGVINECTNRLNDQSIYILCAVVLNLLGSKKCFDTTKQLLGTHYASCVYTHVKYFAFITWYSDQYSNWLHNDNETCMKKHNVNINYTQFLVYYRHHFKLFVCFTW